MARFQPSTHSRNFGYPVPVEGKMAQNYLWQMERDAKALHDKLRPTDTLPGWVNNYIATSADRLQQASRYMQHEMAMQEAHSNPGVRMGAGPPTGQYYVSIMGQRGMSPDGWHWGTLHGRVPETVKIKGPLVPGRRIQFKRLTGNTATQWAILKDRKLMPQHSATRGLPAATGMPGPGMVGFDAYSMHPGVRVVVPPAANFQVNPSYEASYVNYTPPPSPTAGLTKGLGTALGVGGVALIPVLLVGALLFVPLVVNPLIVKAFKPKWSYGRRVVAGIPLGVVIGLGAAATRKLYKSME